MSSAPFLGRLGIAPLSYIYLYTDSAPPRPHPSPALSDKYGRSASVLYNFSVAPQDCHTQEEPLQLLLDAPKVVLTPIVAVHCHDHWGPLAVQEGRVPTGNTKRQPQEVESPTTISDLLRLNIPVTQVPRAHLPSSYLLSWFENTEVFKVSIPASN